MDRKLAMDGDGRWLSYRELGEIRGIGKPSATKLALRNKWRRMRGNDGEARVYVPTDFLKPPKDPSQEASQGHPQEAFPELSRTISILEVAVSMLKEQLEGANTRADSLQVAVDIEKERRAELEAQLAVEKFKCLELRAQIADQAGFWRRLLGKGRWRQ